MSRTTLRTLALSVALGSALLGCAGEGAPGIAPADQKVDPNARVDGSTAPTTTPKNLKAEGPAGAAGGAPSAQ